MYTNTNSTSRRAFARNVEVRNVQVVVSLYNNINPKLSYIFTPEFTVGFSVKSIKFGTRNSKYFVYILQQWPSMRRTHVANATGRLCVNPWVNP